jgi:hypothetical protein
MKVNNYRTTVPVSAAQPHLSDPESCKGSFTRRSFISGSFGPIVKLKSESRAYTQ